MAPKISIIIPAYNEEKYISRCLDSVLNQTFTDFEAICIDDGSTDSTFEILKKYSEKDSRIIPLKNTGKGVSSARNFGIDNAKGNYIGFVDSDDFIQPQMFEFLYKALIENDCYMSCCNFMRTDKFIKSEFEYKSQKCSCNDFFEFENEKSIIISSIWTKLIKKNIITDNKIKFENYRYGEDTLFSSNILKYINECAFVDYPLYLYYTNLSGVTYVNNSDRKWLDNVQTSYFAFNNFLSQNNVKACDFYLGLNMIYLLSYRIDIEKTEHYKSDIKILNKIGKKYVSFYLKSDSFSAFKKIYVFISFYFPFLYKIYRKIRLIK